MRKTSAVSQRMGSGAIVGQQSLWVGSHPRRIAAFCSWSNRQHMPSSTGPTAKATSCRRLCANLIHWAAARPGPTLSQDTSGHLDSRGFCCTTSHRDSAASTTATATGTSFCVASTPAGEPRGPTSWPDGLSRPLLQCSVLLQRLGKLRRNLGHHLGRRRRGGA